ncbi:MAG: EamA family transporter [Spirochaetaceae bacterium]|jgi:drug/metabolite transporter (DMT)-like permease|nr:EamA family transporter [Spirochaetaceae bacterium]
MENRFFAVSYAVLAALCYGVSIPVSKLLLDDLPPVFIAGLVYTGAGLGMLLIKIFQNKNIPQKEAKITKKELPFTIAMVVLDVLAPIFLMIGLSKSTPATASLLNNFEIAATSLVALIVFKEAVGKRTFAAIILITIASIILSVDDISGVSFSFGSIFVLLACVCWGFENNCTSRLSLKDPLEIVIIKGIGSGFTSLIIAFIAKQYNLDIKYILAALLLGFAAYGLSVYFYIYAQRNLGAARTSAYYALSPFIGAGLSFIIFKESLTVSYLTALGIMAIGVYFTAFEKHEHSHLHKFAEHEHRHNHSDGHHNHTHDASINGEHSHPHIHNTMEHEHSHTPDLHHSHEHEEIRSLPCR